MGRATDSVERGEETGTAITALRAETATALAEFVAAVDAVIAASPWHAFDDRASSAFPGPAATSRSSPRASATSGRSHT